ncbi:hypothetical protein [Hyphococcus sp.]|jgi:hypothetical protein|uniref:hypothetical protein n=1 Tax=Hyphococcus sp. TaxID=2038636 RepID=UPI003CCBC8E2
MIEVHNRIFIAGEYACPGCGPASGFDPAGRELPVQQEAERAIVHACKSPCHQRAVGYKGNLDNAHPNYLVIESGNDLYLNMIDPPVPLFKPALFTEAMRFAKEHWDAGRAVLFHCNQGMSRAPSLALQYLAKVRRVISDDSYEAARREFARLYEFYAPGKGIATYLTENWDNIGAGDSD